MVTSLCLISCAMVLLQSGAQPAPLAPMSVPSRQASGGGRGTGEWVLTPRLNRAQELLYRGTFDERSVGGSVQYNREYRLETRLFVLDTPVGNVGNLEVGLFTVLRDRTIGGKPGISTDPVSHSVRLERVQIDPVGRLLVDKGVSLTVPLEGPPTIECGAVVEVPKGPVPLHHFWSVGEPGRPLRTWTVTGTEMVNGTSCVKLVGVQKSEDWDQPRADHTGWRRQDTVWMAPRQGVAYRVERIIERRPPARRDPTYRSLLRYELESSVQYPPQLVEDRRREILQTKTVEDIALPMFSNPSRNEQQLTTLLARLNFHLENSPPTPYREAVLQLKKRVEAARRGEVPPVLPPVVEESEATSKPAFAVGQKAPEFLVPDLLHPQKSARLQMWKGHPVLMVFYSPKSRLASELLRFSQQVADTLPSLAVLTLALSEDPRPVLEQQQKMGLKLPILDGRGLRISYGVDSTPRLVVIDKDGIIRGAYTGWGAGTAREVLEEIQRALPSSARPGTTGRAAQNPQGR